MLFSSICLNSVDSNKSMFKGKSCDKVIVVSECVVIFVVYRIRMVNESSFVLSSLKLNISLILIGFNKVVCCKEMLLQCL